MSKTTLKKAYPILLIILICLTLYSCSGEAMSKIGTWFGEVASELTKGELLFIVIFGSAAGNSLAK